MRGKRNRLHTVCPWTVPITAMKINQPIVQKETDKEEGGQLKRHHNTSLDYYELIGIEDPAVHHGRLRISYCCQNTRQAEMSAANPFFQTVFL